MSTKALLQNLLFVPKEGTSGVYIKKYANNYAIEVDLEKETFFFGGTIKVGEKETQNITKPEDWVVLECVNRLLEKGYKPENIQLEKVYPAGHGFSGRLDICVTHDDGSEYLLIECKTYGKEFDKAFTKLNKDGGQLFTYFKFSNKADIIMLYASELKGKDVVFKNEIVKIEDDYRTGDVKDFYEKWNKLTKDNGVFENWVKPYNFESKALTIKDLEEIRQEDSSFIFNRFLEILRHNVVSDKGNAFNRIFTLFLCKIYDEKDKEDSTNELEFQWFESPFTYDGVYYEKDNHVSFQIRLTDLYKKGMKSFLEKNVTDFNKTDFNNKYSYLTEEQRAPILEEFHKIRLEKNNEFAIKDVYDKESFYDNAVVVKEIVELLQNFKIRYTKKQQYLSDFFELLLTTGLKQESGQFFTPVPVAQFVIKSLPLDNIIEEKLQKGEKDEYLPYVMDYAAGSGHFLTETMHEVQRIIDTREFKDLKAEVKRFIKRAKEYHFDWAFDYVYGIEKDYRLVKVGKVGCYLHGDGLANVIHSDGLARFSHEDYKGQLKHQDKDFPKENKQFDVIVSNPPYSVSAFRNNASKYYNQNEFELYDKLTDNSSEIECLFIERTKQLLKDGGVAGIILPSSILSNSGIYSKSREIILQYFDIVGITELGSNTFMATGTNTVTLFLRRRNNYDCEKIKTFVARFTTDFIDNTVRINEQTVAIEKPIAKYVNHVWETISFDDYVSLLKKTPTKAITEHEIYKEYKKKIKVKNDKEFWNSVLEKEADKLYYFIIAYPQKVVLVKSGEKDAEKRFLGYEFSNRRGSEGIHPIQRGKNIEDCTQMFDATIFDNPEKASTYIYKAFAGDFDFEIDESMQKNVTKHDLVDMLTFDRVDFEKNISISVKKKVKIESKYDLVRIGQIANTQYGFTDKASDKGEIRYLRITDLNDDGSIDLTNEAKFINPSEETKNQFLLNNNDIVIARSGSVGKSAIYKHDKYDKMIFASYLIRLTVNENKIVPEYLFNFTKTQMYWDQVEINSVAVTQPNLNAEKIKEFLIPLPSLDIQHEIVSEIAVLEAKEMNAKEEVENMNENISSYLKNLKQDEINLDSISSFKNGLNYSRSSLGELINIVGVGDFQNRFSPDLESLEKVQIDGNLSEDYILKQNDILVVRSNGSPNLVGRFLFIKDLKMKTSFSGFTIRIRVENENVNSKFLCYYLKSDLVRNKIVIDSQGSNIKSLNQTLLANIKIPLPPLSEQEKIVSEIEKIEAKIKVLETEIAAIPKEKEAVLKSYL